MGPPTTPTVGHPIPEGGGRTPFSPLDTSPQPLFSPARTNYNVGQENLEPNQLGSADSVGGSHPSTLLSGGSATLRTPSGEGSQRSAASRSGGSGTTFSSLGSSILSAGQLAERPRTPTPAHDQRRGSGRRLGRGSCPHHDLEDRLRQRQCPYAPGRRLPPPPPAADWAPPATAVAVAGLGRGSVFLSPVRAGGGGGNGGDSFIHVHSTITAPDHQNTRVSRLHASAPPAAAVGTRAAGGHGARPIGRGRRRPPTTSAAAAAVDSAKIPVLIMNLNTCCGCSRDGKG